MMDRTFKRVVMLVLISGLLMVWGAAAEARETRSEFVVMIDPAHGGDEKGVKINDDVFEKQTTLLIAEQVKLFLERTGKGRVEMTRTDDRAVSATNRIKAAQDARADLFVSIHVNAGFGRQASGYEVHFQGFRVPRGEKTDSGEVVRDMVRTQSLNESVRIAQILQKHLYKVFPRKDRGLRDSPLRIFQGLTMPAVVVETAFALEPNDRKALLNPAQQKAIADAIGKSILEYF